VSASKKQTEASGDYRWCSIRVHGGNDRMVFVFGAVAVTTALHNIMR